MSFPIMPFMKKVPEQPIMSFQTDKNGTFDPFILVNVGTLKWIIDGEEQITNTPSKLLTGDTVNVKVFANDVLENVIVISVDFNGQNIKGQLDFRYFKLTNSLLTSNNSDLTSILFSTLNPGISVQMPSCNLTTVDLSSWANANLLVIRFSGNLNLFAVISPDSYSTGFQSVNGSGCGLNITSVNEMFTKPNTFFSSNPPTTDLTIRAEGGTSVSPGAVGLAAIANLITVYNAAGFAFTAIIN